MYQEISTASVPERRYFALSDTIENKCALHLSGIRCTHIFAHRITSNSNHTQTARQRRLSRLHQQFQMGHKFKSKHKHLFGNVRINRPKICTSERTKQTNKPKSHINYLSEHVYKIYIVYLYIIFVLFWLSLCLFLFLL